MEKLLVFGLSWNFAVICVSEKCVLPQACPTAFLCILQMALYWSFIPHLFFSVCAAEASTFHIYLKKKKIELGTPTEISSSVGSLWSEDDIAPVTPQRKKSSSAFCARQTPVMTHRRLASRTQLCSLSSDMASGGSGRCLCVADGAIS